MSPLFYFSAARLALSTIYVRAAEKLDSPALRHVGRARVYFSFVGHRPGARERGRWPPSPSAISKTPTVFHNKAQGSPLFPNDNKPPRIWNNPPQPQNAETNKPQKERGTLG